MKPFLVFAALIALVWGTSLAVFVRVQDTPPPSVAALPVLRCQNSDPPEVWTRAELEARLHSAQMSLRAAEGHGVWTDVGRRWATLAVAQLLEVSVCASP